MARNLKGAEPGRRGQKNVGLGASEGPVSLSRRVWL